jgi:hypothetical protein
MKTSFGSSFGPRNARSVIQPKSFYGTSLGDRSFSTSLLVLVLCSFFVQGQTTTERIGHIDAQLEHQNYEHFKRLVLSSPDSEVEYLEEFEFDWGYAYTVSVLETQLAYPLSDGTRYTYKYKSTVSRTKMPDFCRFQLFLAPSIYYEGDATVEPSENKSFQMVNDSVFLYFGRVEIEVPKEQMATFHEAVLNGSGRMGQFAFIRGNRIRLMGFR